jgi:hypothetical protein
MGMPVSYSLLLSYRIDIGVAIGVASATDSFGNKTSNAVRLPNVTWVSQGYEGMDVFSTNCRTIITKERKGSGLNY